MSDTPIKRTRVFCDVIPGDSDSIYCVQMFLYSKSNKKISEPIAYALVKADSPSFAVESFIESKNWVGDFRDPDTETGWIRIREQDIDLLAIVPTRINYTKNVNSVYVAEIKTDIIVNENHELKDQFDIDQEL